MIRQVIKIDEGKCTGCGICADACHEGAIGIVDGKARLLREDFCDGLGDCLPACPQDAISFEEREAAAYDAAAVERYKQEGEEVTGRTDAAQPVSPACPSQLQNWPVQIKLAPLQSSSFQDTDLLVAADCCAYTYGNFHADFIRGRTCLIGCSKLDGVDYTEKLTEIIAGNDFKSVTMTRMEVPCCGGLERMVRLALQASGKDLPLQVVTFSLGGAILDQ